METTQLSRPDWSSMFPHGTEELVGSLEIPDHAEITTGYADIYHGFWTNSQGDKVEVAIKVLKALTPKNRQSGQESLIKKAETVRIVDSKHPVRYIYSVPPPFCPAHQTRSFLLESDKASKPSSPPWIPFAAPAAPCQPLVPPRQYGRLLTKQSRPASVREAQTGLLLYYCFAYNIVHHSLPDLPNWLWSAASSLANPSDLSCRHQARKRAYKRSGRSCPFRFWLYSCPAGSWRFQRLHN